MSLKPVSQGRELTRQARAIRPSRPLDRREAVKMISVCVIRYRLVLVIPTVITYITLAQFFGAGLGVRMLEIVSFLLFVAVPATHGR